MADDTKADDQVELVAVVDDEEVEGTDAPEGDGKEVKDDKKKVAADPEAEEDGDESEETEGDEGKDAKGDARVATDEDADNTQNRERKRETAKERRARQKAHIARREKELALYKARNEELERRFSQLDARQTRSEQITIGQAITTLEAQIAEAKKLEAESIKAQDGESAVEAREIREALETKRDRLVVARDRVTKQPSTSRTPPPEMRNAIAWIEANKDWYDPKGGNEDSAIASAIEDRMVREGKLDPSTQDFWDELDRRLVKRGIKKAATEDSEEELDDEEQEEEAPPRKLNGGAKKTEKSASNGKKGGGPKVTVGGEKRTLKANEVYIDPDRKQAMIEAGVWDDPKLRQDMLRRYHKFDSDARASR